MRYVLPDWSLVKMGTSELLQNFRKEWRMISVQHITICLAQFYFGWVCLGLGWSVKAHAVCVFGSRRVRWQRRQNGSEWRCSSLTEQIILSWLRINSRAQRHLMCMACSLRKCAGFEPRVIFSSEHCRIFSLPLIFSEHYIVPRETERSCSLIFVPYLDQQLFGREW